MRGDAQAKVAVALVVVAMAEAKTVGVVVGVEA